MKSQSSGSHKNQSQNPVWYGNDWASSAALATLSDTGFLLQSRAYDLNLPSTTVYFHEPEWDVKDFAGLLCTLCYSPEDGRRQCDLAQGQIENVWVILWNYSLLFQ